MVELPSYEWEWGLAGRSEAQSSQLLFLLTEFLHYRSGSRRNARGLPRLLDSIILNWDLGIKEALHSGLLSSGIDFLSC